MARVEWSRYPGEEIETVIAIMLCREYPNANRPKPARGDGGIDLLVPGADGAAIYQIKGYTGNLTLAQKRHIKESWEALAKYSAANSLKVSEWNLVIPENLTNEQREWVEELTKDADFPCHLHTLDFVEGLVAKYSDVIDYYLRDGKDRLDGAVKTYLSIISPDTSTEPAASQKRIVDLHEALNKFDPHYRYDFAVDSLETGQECPAMPTDTPWLVAAVQQNHGNRCITYKIFARFAEATNERPVPGRFTLVAEPGSELESQIEDWIEFGAPLQNVPATDIFAGLPGGFEATLSSGFVSLRASGPIPEAVSEITIDLLDPDGSRVESLDFVTDEVTTGQERTAVRSTGHERLADVVTFELRASSISSQPTVQITLRDITGKRPSDVLPSLRFISGLRPPRRIQISIRNGPALTPPGAFNNELISDADGHNMIIACEALTEIQKAVFVRITIPDLATTTWNTLESWINAATILRGEQLSGKWHEVKVHLPPGTDPMPGVGALLNRGPWTVQIGDNTYSIGTVDLYPAAGHVDKTRPPEQHDDHLDVWYVPAGTNTMTLQLASPDVTLPAGPEST
jgi:hypothetical protein